LTFDLAKPELAPCGTLPPTPPTFCEVRISAPTPAGTRCYPCENLWKKVEEISKKVLTKHGFRAAAFDNFVIKSGPCN